MRHPRLALPRSRRLVRAVLSLAVAAGLAAAPAPAFGPSPALAQASASVRASPRDGTAPARDRDALAAALDSAARAYAADSTVAGVAVAVVHRGDTLLLGGYGRADLEHDVPTPADAVYQVGSITKQFTAAAVLRLAEEGALRLDADVTEYLDDYDTRGHAVSVRDLLHHTSGIRSYTSMAAFGEISRQELTRDSLLRLVEAEPFDFAPGTAMIYSNTGYFLLGLVVEEVSGQDYGAYLEEHLFGPAGMEDSHYCDERAVVEHRAHGYAWAGPETGFRHKGYLDHTWPYSAGSLCSTAGNLAAWTRALHGGRILSEASYREMTTPGRLRDGTALRYGMGLAVHRVGDRLLVGHGGGINGFLSDARHYPEEELTIVALQNSTGSEHPASLSTSLARLVLGPPEEPAAAPYEGDLAALAGTYAGRGRGRTVTVEVVARDGGLAIREGGRDEETRPLEHLTGLTWGEGKDRFTFVRAGDRVVELRMDVVSGHYPLRRVDRR